jgi:hypothetical protein
LVKNIQQGCDLYKQAKESFVQVKRTADEVVAIGKELSGFWGQLRKFFGAKPQAVVAKSKKSEYVNVDETQVKVEIVKNLTEFFRLQEQLAAHIREEEEKSRTVYDPNQNHMEAALKRVMAQQQMADLEVTIRETMVYQSPPEMGALYSSVFSMREVIQAEQEEARLKQEAAERVKQWQRQEEKRDFQAKSAYLIATAILITYLWMWFLFVGKLGKT